ncbi:mechanosensitive ion channel family protein [Frankia sp. Mgl5]|uniref:mechanosensitive ion channel family protein n=1 Tax=Frankia sp. Mgl5 TaxID=2933793 RepID=UPI00200D29DB|nr:mechanosensitive ion channel family protein [Frankia sp. Mgl5]MCK9926530.1 mechanosensitive ion channel family protein [Frankia sp. Mgl5]
MITAAAPLTDISEWARGRGLEIVMIVIAAVLLTRFATWVGDRVERRIDQQSSQSDGVVRSEATKHRHAVVQVLTWVSLALVYCVAVVLVLQRLGVPVTGIVAPATVVGVALGFGAQRVVQDVLAGFFLVTERQYGFGDLVRLVVLGAPSAITGTVEEVTLRITSVRTSNGEVVITPNGQIVQVVNLSRDWARAVVDVPIPTSVDVTTVSDVLTRVGAEAYADDALHDLLLDAPTVMGVESIDLDQFKIRVVARTLPGKQFEVGRALRAKITVALLRAGIHVPADLDTAPPTSS